MPISEKKDNRADILREKSLAISRDKAHSPSITDVTRAIIGDENATLHSRQLREWKGAAHMPCASHTPTHSLQNRLAREAERFREEAEKLPHGRVRDALERKARQAETGSHINDWLTSPGLQQPKDTPSAR